MKCRSCHFFISSVDFKVAVPAKGQAMPAIDSSFARAEPAGVERVIPPSELSKRWNNVGFDFSLTISLHLARKPVWSHT